MKICEHCNGSGRADGGPILHHRDCDGFHMHVPTAIKTEHGTWKPACNKCGELPGEGSYGSRFEAEQTARPHGHSEKCKGECHAWEDAA